MASLLIHGRHRSFSRRRGPNASTKKGGGKTKVSARWEICLKLLGDHPEYQEAIAAAANVPRERSPWANRIKNRLRTMGKETRAYIEIMGQTGARIECAADIDTTKENSFTRILLDLMAEARHIRRDPEGLGG
ncbi:hypothetical protein B0H14DRAFT_3514652 [Mycena olivaceomarginata]|nr:hypothetical protein B0H14DRAFT_3514652 [Mycena olivaceomarginata]